MVSDPSKQKNGHAGLANVFVKQTSAKSRSERLSETFPSVNWRSSASKTAVERQALPLCLRTVWQDDSTRVSLQPYRVVE